MDRTTFSYFSTLLSSRAHILIMNAGDIITQIQHQAPNIIAIVAAIYMFAHWKAGKWVDILSTFLIAVVIYCLATGQNVWTFGLSLLNAILGIFGWHIG